MNAFWLIGQGWVSCLVVALIALTCRASDPAYYFIQISDTHWGARDGAALTRRAVEAVNALPVKVEFVVFTGDLCSDSIKKDVVVNEGLVAVKGLKAPVYYVPGNHDILKTDSGPTTKRFIEKFGPLNRKVEIHGVTCLFLNTEPVEGESRSPGQVQRTWVEESLGSGKGTDPVLIFMHRPPIRDLVHGFEEERTWDDPYDSRWGELFAKHSEIKGVFAGHFHRDELRWIGAVPVFVAPALARFWDRQPSFRLYELKDGKVNSRTMYPE